MEHFRDDNTEGFSPAALVALNSAYETIYADAVPANCDDDAVIGEARKNISDRLTNVWQLGMTDRELVDAFYA